MRFAIGKAAALASLVALTGATARAVDLEDQALSNVKAKLPVASKRPPVFSDLAFELAYNGMTDFNDPGSPRRTTNSIEASASVDVLKTFVAYVETDFVYTAYGDEIVIDNDQPNLSDFEAGAYRKFELGPRHSILVSGFVDAPSSAQARREGYYAVSGASARLQSRVWSNWLQISNVASVYGVANRFERSPTTLSPNPGASGSYSLWLYARLAKGLRIGASAGARATRYLDGTNGMSFNNAEALLYDVGNWSFHLTYSNGDWIDRQSLDFWYVDRYRNVAAARVAYDF